MNTILPTPNLLCRHNIWLGLGLTGSLLVWSGCSGFPQVGAGAHHPTSAQLQTAMQWEDHYIYFPGYEIYYNRTQSTYVYLTVDGWAERFEPPPEVDLQALLASPFVEAPFNGRPAAHHARMIRDYPRDWGLPKPRDLDGRQARGPSAR